MTKEEQIKELAHIIFSEQMPNLPKVDVGNGMFRVEGALPIKVIRPIAEQIYHQGYKKE